MNIKNIDTGDIEIGIWKVRITGGLGVVMDNSANEVASFTVLSEEQIVLTSGDAKYADMALIALRSFLRYGIRCD